jgi:hypothetical protein
MMQSGIIEKEDVLKSLHAYKALTTIVAQNGTAVLEEPISDIFAMIDAYLAPMLAEETSGDSADDMSSDEEEESLQPNNN